MGLDENGEEMKQKKPAPPKYLRDRQQCGVTDGKGAGRREGRGVVVDGGLTGEAAARALLKAKELISETRMEARAEATARPHSSLRQKPGSEPRIGHLRAVRAER